MNASFASELYIPTEDVLKPYEIEGGSDEASLPNTRRRHDENISILPCDSVSKIHSLQERFMLDLLTIPPSDKEAAHHGIIDTNDLRSNVEVSDLSLHTVESGLWWDSQVLRSDRIENDELPEPNRGTHDASSESDNKALSKSETHDEGMNTEVPSENAGATNEDPLNCGSETRRRRRREFHKIHTRRSRAKLNEKMEMLRNVLPEPPNGLVIKSKAQIIDFAISVIAQWSVPHVQKCNCTEKGARLANVDHSGELFTGEPSDPLIFGN